jgi:GcrA cell cycle regulator
MTYEIGCTPPQHRGRGCAPELLWPAELVTELRRLFTEDKLTMREMASALGRSRNSVIAKCHREGLIRGARNNASKRSSEAKRPYRRAPWAIEGLYANSRPKMKKRRQPEFVDLPVEKPAKPLTLLDLTSKSCRWPLGEPSADMLYCGGLTQGGAWCAKHHAMAYRKADGRRGNTSENWSAELRKRAMPTVTTLKPAVEPEDLTAVAESP